MGIKMWDWFRGKDGKANEIEVAPCRDVGEAWVEYRVRELAFWSCVNLIANAMARCEFRTFVNNKEVRNREYWLWNVEPNINQNSTAFLHKLVAKLYENNEALIVPTRKREGEDALVVADGWDLPAEWPSKQNEYKSVLVGDLTYEKAFSENKVLHLTLNQCNIKPVLDGLYESYLQLISAAMRNYTWGNGQHWKVHVDQVASGTDGWAETFRQMVEAQIKPFLNSTAAVLPELEGWKYENVDNNTEDGRDASPIRDLIRDVFDFTANAFLIPPVLLRGEVQGTADAMNRFLSACIDPLADQLQEEINRKRYGFEAWMSGSYMRIDTSAIQHFDLVGNAANVEKLIGSGYSYNDIQRAVGGVEIDEDWANAHFLTKNFGKAEELLRGETT